MNFDGSERRDSAAETPREATPGRRSTEGPTSGRRNVLRAIGGLALVGPLAGCSGDGGDGDDSDGGDSSSDGGGASSVDEWLANTGNYDGVEDATGEDSVTVEVGARGNSGANAFAPAAVEVSSGTTVTWEWVDGNHNAVATEGEFDSGEPERDATFEHTFDAAGTYLYYCAPHRSIDMKGAVVVSDGDTGESGGASD